MKLPEIFVNTMRSTLGNDWNAFEHSLQETAPTSVRYGNKFAGVAEGDAVPWCDRAIYLPSRPSFTFDPLFHAGGYYVQEASSMFLFQVIKQLVKEPILALDLCAAPGGKSTLLSQFLPSGSFLLANEYVKQRAFILSENLQKWGESYCAVTNSAPKDFSQLSGLFDFVLVDAPCSGEGMFRKDAGSISEWSDANVKNCVIRQREILDAVYPSLHEGGLLVYSTCTYNAHEDEEQVRYLHDEYGMEVVKLAVNPDWGIVSNDWGYHFYPHKVRGEGFFLSVLRKTETSQTTRVKEAKSCSMHIPMDGLKNPENYSVCEVNGVLSAVPSRWRNVMEMLKGKLEFLHAGIPMFEVKGRDLVPQTGLALSQEFSRNYPIVELNREQAIAYLQREAISIGDASKGFVAVSYEEHPLGWVKNLGNRCNNMYPYEWRIRSREVK